MTITFPRSIPDSLIISRCTMRTVSRVGVSESIFTGAQQVQAHQGQWWEADISIAPSERADAAPVTAFFASLNGKEKTVLFGDPSATTARGSAGTTPGAPLVKGASQTGAELLCDGAPISTTGYLLEGDYIQLGTGSTSRLHMVLEDVNSDGSGNFTLNLWPDLRSSPDNDAVITLANPKGVFRFNKNITQWSEQTVIYGASFTLKEAL